MKKIITLVLSVLPVHSALAAGYSEIAGGLWPTATVTFQFGGPVATERLHAQFAASQPINIDKERRLLPIAAVDVGSQTGAYSSFLGVPFASYESAGSASADDKDHTWLWVGASVVAAVGIAAAAGGGGGGGDDTGKRGNNGGNTTNCGVSGDVVGPNPPVIDPNCR